MGNATTLHTQVVLLKNEKFFKPSPAPSSTQQKDNDDENVYSDEEFEKTTSGGSKGFMYALAVANSGSLIVKINVLKGAPVKFFVYKGEERIEVLKREEVKLQREKIENVKEGEVFVLSFETVGRSSLVCFSVDQQQCNDNHEQE